MTIELPDPVNELIDLLKKIQNDKEVAPLVQYLPPDSTFVFVIHEEASGLACDCLVGSGSSGVHWSNVKKVEEAGFRVFPLERDSFGWLVGGIDVPDKGVISFG